MAAAWIAGCFSPSLTPGLPCATDTDPPCPDGQVCDEAANTCVPESALGTWRDDTATDFTDPTVALDNAIVEPNGAIGPVPYYVEGTAIAGIAGRAIGSGNEATVTWDELIANPIAGHGFLHGDIDFDASGMVPGTGLGDNVNTTILFSGEIFLAAGTTSFRLDADDRGFFDVDSAAANGFTRVVSDVSGGAPSSGSVTVAADGWYPFHGATETDSGVTTYGLQSDAGGGFADIDPTRLRARVDGVAGLVLDGFLDDYLHSYSGTSVSTVPLEQRQDYGDAGFPPDVGDLGNGRWTVRWQGQVLVTVAGAYAFELDTEGGHRMWIDGGQVADVDDAGPPEVTVTPQVQLDVGWHDIVIDLIKSSTSSDPTHVQITVDSGPELVGGFFPVDRQRPVVGRGARWAVRGSGAVVAIPDGASASKTLPVTLPGSGTAMEVDYTYSLTHPVQAQLGATFARPGDSQTLFNPGDLTGTGAYSGRLRFVDVAANGSWTVTASDNTLDTMVGSITEAQISLTYAGGTPPFEPVARYTSRVRDLGPVVAFSGVRWQGRQAADDAIKVAVRSCDTADACAAEPWTLVPTSGAPAGITARQFAQYQVEITNDTDVPSALDWIEIDYRLP